MKVLNKINELLRILLIICNIPVVLWLFVFMFVGQTTVDLITLKGFNADEYWSDFIHIITGR